MLPLCLKPHKGHFSNASPKWLFGTMSSHPICCSLLLNSVLNLFPSIQNGSYSRTKCRWHKIGFIPIPSSPFSSHCLLLRVLVSWDMICQWGNGFWHFKGAYCLLFQGVCVGPEDRNQSSFSVSVFTVYHSTIFHKTGIVQHRSENLKSHVAS
jgi:hypothetical protein